MLKLKPNCECCDADLPPDAPNAMICSFECTFCADCNEAHFKNVCPNCGGDMMRRPTRSAAWLEKHPASAERVNRHHNACAS